MKSTTTLADDGQLRALLMKRKGKQSLRAFAPTLGVTYQFLAAVLAGTYLPGPQIAEALGYQQVTMYRRAPRKRAKK